MSSPWDFCDSIVFFICLKLFFWVKKFVLWNTSKCEVFELNCVYLSNTNWCWTSCNSDRRKSSPSMTYVNIIKILAVAKVVKPVTFCQTSSNNFFWAITCFNNTWYISGNFSKEHEICQNQFIIKLTLLVEHIYWCFCLSFLIFSSSMVSTVTVWSVSVLSSPKTRSSPLRSWRNKGEKTKSWTTFWQVNHKWP